MFNPSLAHQREISEVKLQTESRNSHFWLSRKDRREKPRRAVAVRDKSIFFSPQITPFRTGIYGITWVFMGVNNRSRLVEKRLRKSC